MIKQADWIKSPDRGDICTTFRKAFVLSKPVADARLYITALGVYEAALNGERIGDFILAPGWTSYEHRVQVQKYDIRDLLQKENILTITLGKGWCFGEFTEMNKAYPPYPAPAVICALHIRFSDGTDTTIYSDDSFEAAPSGILYADLYDGEVYDARDMERKWISAQLCDYPKDILIPQEGPYIREIEEIQPVALITTPRNEQVIDFGQNVTGYVKFVTDLPCGTVVEISHAEALDARGNFYTENLRSARQRVTYIINGTPMEYKPHFSFQGFRYIRLDKWSGPVRINDFKAVIVHSDMKRTGYFECSNEKVNKLFQNIVWGQRGNFLDVPTDCPQRDERLGWTGDAQVFIRTASYNYDVRRFFTKWLADLKADQFENGGVPAVIPNVLKEPLWDNTHNSAGWGDAAVICPWQLYLTYGDKEILVRQYDSMKRWIDYIQNQGDDRYLWNSGPHYGDWCGLDAEPGSYVGATPKDLIATAYYAYSTGLFIKAGTILGKDMADYRSLYDQIVLSFQRAFIKDDQLTAKTQTAHALALYFNLCGTARESVARELAELVMANGNRLTTGFVGTPYLLHALSQNGYPEIAYSLLLQEEFPSWLYSVNKGATTIWEHWDGIKDDGSFWSADMNSFNHYAYGAVADWMYGVVCGINVDESAPGFENVRLKPIPDKRLRYAEANIDTRFGRLSSKWSMSGDSIRYEFEVPHTGTLIIGEDTYTVGKGRHTFERVL